MALDAYLQIDGIPGEATDDKHENWIEILEMHHTVQQAASATVSGTQSKTAAKANHDAIKFRKTIDKASPLLLEKCSSGEHIPTLKVEFMRSVGKEKVSYLTIEIAQAIISEVQSVASKSGAEEPGEWVHFRYGEIKWKYKVVKADGTVADNINGSWNLTKSATAS